MSNYSFDLKHTNVIKGFLVLALVFHHVFNPDVDYWINFAAGGTTPILLTQVAVYGRVCIGGFSFLSAYGITKKLIKEEATKNILISRLVKLYFSFWPIYILGFAGTVVFGDKLVQEIYYSASLERFSWVYPILDIMGVSKFFNAPQLNVTWWYMSAAIYIIFITPLFYRFYCKFKYVAVFLMCIIPYIINVESLILFPTIMLGVCFAKDDLFVKIKEKALAKMRYRFLTYFLILFLIYFTFELTNISSAAHSMQFSTLTCLMFCYIILADIPVISHILAFLGKHSANIYYFHTFIYWNWFPYTIYSLGNKVLIYCIVFGSSLAVSAILELIKKVIKYKNLEQKVISFLINYNKKARI